MERHSRPVRFRRPRRRLLGPANREHFWSTIPVSAALAAMLAIGQAAADVFFVNTTVDSIDVNPGDGIAADANGMCSVRAAIMEASASFATEDTIIVPAGTYPLTLLGDWESDGLTGDLNVRWGPLNILGAGSDRTIIDGGHATSVIGVATTFGSVLLSGITFANGGSLTGSGVFHSQGALVMEDCVVSNCLGPAAYWMGGSGANVVMNRCRIVGNLGSGVVVGYGPASFNDCTFSDNHGVIGGGVRVLGYSADIPTTFERCTISGNTASYSGGAYYGEAPSQVVLRNCTVSGNSSPNLTGGLEGVVALLDFCTITANTGAGFGGCSISNVRAHGTIIAGNVSTGGYGDFWSLHSQGYNLLHTTQFTQIGGDTATNLLDVDPLLLPLANNGGHTPTHALAPGSPALDAGNPSEFPPTDQRGVARPADGDGDKVALPDIGALELAVFADCNANGLPDEGEIAGNANLDADGTGILDECEEQGDLNGDGLINGADLGSLLAQWGPCPPKGEGACPADLTGDGVVNGADLGALLAGWDG